MLSDLTGFSDIAPAFPELLLAIGALVLLMIGVFSRGDGAMRVAGISIGLLIAVCLLAIIHPAEGVLFNGGFVQDAFARYMKVLVLAGAAFALIMSVSSASAHELAKFEYSVLIVLSTLGMLVMVSANDLMVLYIGLEMQSLALYVLAAMRRDSTQATEAGLKYFVLGALSSGMLLYGSSMVYGFTGQTQFDEIARAVSLADANSIGIIFGLVFVVAGLAFKISAVPFHMWTPDVYEGSPTPVTAFFASAPKVAAMAIFIRVLFGAFEHITFEWQQIVIFLSIVSMVLAAFAAIGQNNIKRLIAYSSIGHVGFALVGLSSGHQTGVEGVAVYMAIYLVMTVGLFACILSLKSQGEYVQKISDLSGLEQSRPFVAGIMAILMFSLIGLPPLAGFFAKWFVFLAAVESGLYVLAVIGVLASAVSAYYYLRVVKTMYFDAPVLEFAEAPGELRIVMGLSGIAVIAYYFTIAGPLSSWANAAAASLF